MPLLRGSALPPFVRWEADERRRCNPEARQRSHAGVENNAVLIAFVPPLNFMQAPLRLACARFHVVVAVASQGAGLACELWGSLGQTASLSAAWLA